MKQDLFKMEKELLNSLIINGRYFLKDNSLFFFNVGSGVSFKTNSKEIEFDLSIHDSVGYIYIIVDRDYNEKTKTKIKDSQKIIFKLDGKKHTVDVVKANESSQNTLELKGIKIDGEFLMNIPAHKHFVKVYGDSSVNGFGILSRSGEANADNCDGVLNYVFSTLYNLNCKIDILASSGWGLTFSKWTDPQTLGIEKFVDNVAVNDLHRWDNKEKEDLLIISLGTNDHSYVEISKDREAAIRKYIGAYENLIENERKRNPDLPILMLYGSLKEESVFDMQERTFDYLKKKYKNLHILKIAGDNSAISNHSYITQHPKMSEQLKQKIYEILQ